MNNESFLKAPDVPQQVADDDADLVLYEKNLR
jgi:hypothetical protein